MELFDVKGKSVLITGASRGIGRELALGFRDAGATVYGTGSRPESVEWMAEEKIIGRPADMRDPDQIANVVKEIVEKEGRLDCLINNAGIASNKPASGFKEQDMEDMISTNFKGVFRSCQAYHKAHRKKGGVIINVASVLGMVGVPLASVYSGTKGAVIQLTRSLAVEWAGSNFRLNTICPGFIETDMTTMIKEKPDVLAKMEAQVPMKRLGKPKDLLGAAIFLASDASSYMTGQNIIVDGGYTVL